MVERGHFVGGFGRIVDIPAPVLLADPARAGAIAADEARMIAILAPLAGRIAARLGAGAGDWRISGLDTEGLDIVAAGRAARAEFAAPATSADTVVAAARALAG